MHKISGLVISFNEEHNIVDCLRSLKQVCDDVVVVDSCSTDRTVELARAEGATVLIQPFLGDGPQRIHGLPHCRHDWVVNLDADERLEPDLVDWLRRTDLDVLACDVVDSRRRNYIGERTTRFGGQYPDYVSRIFNRTRAAFSPVVAHTRVTGSRHIRIPCHITHYSYRDYADLFARQVKYAKWMADNLAERGKPVSPLSAPLHGFWSFFRHYVVKLGFLAGQDGLAIALGKGVGSYLKYAHAAEQIKRKARQK
ncbi:glycosyltransferase family 2 protein [Crenobacter caeni]|uniref:Glycosyltransferase family 2 protein n=1 Tax=Crenobacter caeni TaxID=2705474 RepID=A0A6B2KTJ0_9NEIS|nr:glycosyltransferase family 2 protein [Crenobacter caeni]NDV13468.1 glycosyltransferase family 2 protein [Crenobacter caeni]